MSATVVRIEDQAEKPPMIEVRAAPGGHNIYVGPLVNNATLEHGALINLLGVDQEALIPDQGWRFVDPSLPEDATRNALHIIWIAHDRSGPFSNGDLQIGFNSVFPGHHYANPLHTADKNLGPGTDQWVTVYTDETLVLLFKPLQNRS
jgi:hypothetical protein